MSGFIQVKEFHADFFVTGNEYMRESLDLKFIPRVNLCNDDTGGGVSFADNQNLQDSYLIVNLDLEFTPRANLCEDYMTEDDAILADYNQNLQQSYLIAKSVFECTKPGTIKFVLIGLSPYNFPTNGKESPTVCQVEEKVLADYFKLCVDNGAKPVVIVLPVHSALKKNYNADVLKLFRNTINKVVKKYKATVVDLLDIALPNNLFQNIYRLNSEGAAVVSSLLSERLYFAKVISLENIMDMDLENIMDMDVDFFNVLSKYFSDDYKRLIHNIFCRMACDDFNRLSEILPKDECKDLMACAFSELTYNHLANLSDMLLKDDYNDLVERIFKISAEKIRRKDKIKVGFSFAFGSMWFGDNLYNLFAQDERFEPTVFILTKSFNKSRDKEAVKDFERFKSHGINIFNLNDRNLSIPEQDVIFCLVPYEVAIPAPFRLVNLKVTTLLASFSYSLSVADRGGMLNGYFFRVLYKMFASSPVELELLRQKNKVFSETRMLYSGYPKQDIFFESNSTFHFDWKMAHPNAKKIIWAPHHSVVNNGPLLSTFHWNYKFMYEFAKAHPEISWIVKPHSNIHHYLVYVSKVFPTVEALQEYLQKWNDLPNAQVYMGAYYQDIFATSDGMIQDCGSFIAEYQYVDKPMIYLTRDTQRFNELGNEILKASYTVDGKDLDAIAAMMQRVFIEGDDYKAAQRKEVFDKYLNYPKTNGMLASEFIYKNIADEFKEESK